LDDKKKFVTGDVLSFIVQCIDAGILSSTSNPSLGKTIILIGLALQLIFFGIFIVTTAVLHVRMNTRSTVSMTMTINTRMEILDLEPVCCECYVIYHIYGIPLRPFL